jgi:hypothetical protein
LSNLKQKTSKPQPTDRDGLIQILDTRLTSNFYAIPLDVLQELADALIAAGYTREVKG